MADSAAEHGSPGAHDVGHGHSPPRPFARLKHLLQPERRDIVAVVVFAVAVAVLSLATPIAVESLVNTVAFGILLWPILVIAGVLMGILGLAAAIRAMVDKRAEHKRYIALHGENMPEISDWRWGSETASV